MLDLHKQNTFCRKCGHMFSYHCIYTQVYQGPMVLDIIQPLEMVPCGNYTDKINITCGCEEYEPADNLEWLELKAKQKQVDIHDDTPF